VANRKLISSKIEREILFRNEATCCICGKSNVQIHHIDGNHSNNQLINLAVLCLDHHNQASSISSMTRGLKPSLVRKFKIDWEGRISRKRQLVRQNISKNKDEQTFIKFEIKRLVYSLPAYPDKKSTNSTIEQIYQWSVFEATTKDILKAFDYIHWFLKDSQIAILLDRLWEFFWQFVGPKDVPMGENDEKNIISTIELIGNLGRQVVIIEQNPRVFNNLFSVMKNFQDVASWYHKPKLKMIIKRQFIGIKKELIKAKKYPQKVILLNKIEKKIKDL